jgi:hypothetical protein
MGQTSLQLFRVGLSLSYQAILWKIWITLLSGWNFHSGFYWHLLSKTRAYLAEVHPIKPKN